MTTRRFNRNPPKGTPQLPQIGTDPKTIRTFMQAVRETVEVHERRIGDVRNSFVRVSELEDLGLIQVVDGNIVEPVQYDHFSIRWGEDNAAALTAASLVPRNITMPFRGYIEAYAVLGYGGIGSCSVDVRKGTCSDFPLGASLSIVDYAPISLSSEQCVVETELDGWDRGFERFDILSFTVDSTSTFTEIEIDLFVRKAP